MTESFFSDLQKELDKTVVAFRKDLAKVRTGRASTALLEGVMVDYYGSPTPLNQLGSLSAPEPRLLVIQAYDQSAMGNIEKGILKADLGLTPSNDGKVIRIPIPELSEEGKVGGPQTSMISSSLVLSTLSTRPIKSAVIF